MLCTGYNKLVIVLCFCNVHHAFCMQSTCMPANVLSGCTQQMGRETFSMLGFIRKFNGSQKAGAFLAAAENALRKTVGTAGVVTGHSLRFVWHYPVVSLGAVAVACWCSVTVRECVKKTASKIIYATLGGAVRSWLGLKDQADQLTKLENAARDQSAQLRVLSTAANQHAAYFVELGQRLVKVQGGVDAQAPTLITLTASHKRLQGDVNLLRKEMTLLFYAVEKLNNNILSLLTARGRQVSAVPVRNNPQFRVVPNAGRGANRSRVPLQNGQRNVRIVNEPAWYTRLIPSYV